MPNKSSATEVVVGCSDYSCDFNQGKNREGLPVLFVDEQIYRELPAFLIATVDKLALLPWRGETGMLFGRVKAKRGRTFAGPSDGSFTDSVSLPKGLLPPELIVQDELHLIAGPLGTMVGLFETAIEALCQREGGPLPKIVASTATIRRAKQQVQALYGRSQMKIFPPPGIDDGETFFAQLDKTSEGRLYVGVAAQGRALKGILLRTYTALLVAAQRCYDPKGPADQPADAYMTLVGYFNSLRELGGVRRLVEDDVRRRSATAEGAPDFPGIRFYLLHSLSHLLMSALSLECGYAASALHERIYCAPRTDGC